MDTDQNDKQNDVTLPEPTPKDDRLLKDTGVVIVDKDMPKKEPVGESAKHPAKETEKGKEKIAETIPSEKGSMGSVADLEEAFQGELDSLGREKRRVGTDDMDDLRNKLEALQSAIESIRSVKKSALETELAEFKTLKGEIEEGLDKLKELEALNKKVEEERARLAQADTIEHEVEEDIRKIEEEVEKSKNDE